MNSTCQEPTRHSYMKPYFLIRQNLIPNEVSRKDNMYV